FQAAGKAREYWEQWDRANDEAEKARTNEAEARAKGVEARESRDRALRARHAAQMGPIWSRWQEGKVATVRRLLRELEPRPGEPDVRGWEWHYQWRLAHPELRLLEGHPPPTLGQEDQTLAFSPDGRWLVSSGLAGQDTDLIVWDLATGRELRRLRDPATKMG